MYPFVYRFILPCPVLYTVHLLINFSILSKQFNATLASFLVHIDLSLFVLFSTLLFSFHSILFHSLFVYVKWLWTLTMISIMWVIQSINRSEWSASTSISTCINQYVHQSVRTYISTFISQYVHQSVRTSVSTFISQFVRTSVFKYVSQFTSTILWTICTNDIINN